MKDIFGKDGQFSWEELKSLAKALGFDENVFYEAFHEEQRQKEHVTHDDLKLLLEGSTFYPYLNKTFNQHDGSYNIKVVSKAMDLLIAKYLSISLLRLARASFQAYEHSDAAGLQEKYVLRALKVCNKIMAPLKLHQMLRHMKRLVADRLMMYEYLDVVASADNVSSILMELPQKKEVKLQIGSKNLYELCDFEEELLTYDGRCYKYLDEQFKESLKIIPIKSTGGVLEDSKQTKEWVKPPLALVETRINNSKRNRNQSKKLSDYLKSSNAMVRKSQYGDVCACSVACTHGAEDKQDIPVINETQCRTNDEISKETVKCSNEKRRYPLIITSEEIENTKQQLENIQWDLVVKKGKLRKKLKEANGGKSRDEIIESKTPATQS